MTRHIILIGLATGGERVRYTIWTHSQSHAIDDAAGRFRREFNVPAHVPLAACAAGGPMVTK